MNVDLVLCPTVEITDVLLVVRRMQEEHRDKERKLCMCFVNTDKAFDRIPRKVYQK